MALTLLSQGAQQLQASRALSKKKPAFVSSSQEWDEMHPKIIILWPGMELDELKATMEEVYSFRAT